MNRSLCILPALIGFLVEEVPMDDTRHLSEPL